MQLLPIGDATFVGIAPDTRLSSEACPVACGTCSNSGGDGDGDDDGNGGGTGTAAPSPEPTEFPTTVVDNSSCIDSTAWSAVDRRNNVVTCQEVARNPNRLCNLTGRPPDTRTATEACPTVCTNI